MKKINYFLVLLFVACVLGSCAIGSYVPSTLNVGGVSTQVVLSQANYRVVRNIEAVIEVNNANLRRADVEKSAFAELTRKYPLTGSQAYINVVLEEIRREKYGLGGIIHKRKQFVAVRATIIEFLQENGEPIKSAESPYNTSLQRIVKEETNELSTEEVTTPKSENKTEVTETETNGYNIANDYYIAYLISTERYNQLEDKQLLNELCNTQNILEFSKKFEKSVLRSYGKKHDKRLVKYAKY